MMKVPWTGSGYGPWTTLGSSRLIGPTAVAVDGSGNVYIADGDPDRWLTTWKLDFGDAPSLSFPTSTPVGSLDTTVGPQTVTVSNIGNQNLAFTAPASGSNPSYAANFPENSSDANLCTSGTPLAPLASCDVSAKFPAYRGGTNTGGITLTDNNLNVANETQTISLSGTGQMAQTITWATIPSQVQGGTVTLSATASSGLAVSFASTTAAVCTVSGTTASLIAPGTCSITASQAGDSNYAAALSVTQSFTVTPVFVLTVTPTAQVKTLPGTASLVLTLAPVNGFSGSVTLSCSGVPAGAKCVGLPHVQNLNGKTAVTFDTGVNFPAGTQPGVYVITFNAVSGKYNNSTTAMITVQ